VCWSLRGGNWGRVFVFPPSEELSNVHRVEMDVVLLMDF
jgi:hypothetical protein